MTTDQTSNERDRDRHEKSRGAFEKAYPFGTSATEITMKMVVWDAWTKALDHAASEAREKVHPLVELMKNQRSLTDDERQILDKYFWDSMSSDATPPPTAPGTPRTDAEKKWTFGDNRPGMSFDCVTVDFARTLERELAQCAQRTDAAEREAEKWGLLSVDHQCEANNLRQRCGALREALEEIALSGRNSMILLPHERCMLDIARAALNAAGVGEREGQI